MSGPGRLPKLARAAHSASSTARITRHGDGDHDEYADGGPVNRADWERLVIDAGLPHDLLLVALAVGTLCTDQSRADLEVSDSLLCRMLGYAHVNQPNRLMRELRDLGVITRDRKGNQFHPASVYHLTDPGPDLPLRVTRLLDKRGAENIRKTGPRPAAHAGSPTDADSETSLYRWFDIEDTPLYTGITAHMHRRQAGHIRASSWMQFADRWTVEPFPDRETAVKAERTAIRAEHPLFNKVHNDTPEARLRAVEYLVSHGRYDLLTPAISRG